MIAYIRIEIDDNYQEPFDNIVCMLQDSKDVLKWETIGIKEGRI